MCFGLKTSPPRLPVRTGKQLSKCERKATEVRATQNAATVQNNAAAETA